MGLDIVAVNRIKRIICNVDAEGWPIDPVTGARLDHETLFRGYQNPDFPGVADEIEEGIFYGFEKSVSFNAGSYSSYGGWRDKLAALAGWPKSKFWHYAEGRWAESHCVRCWGEKPAPSPTSSISRTVPACWGRRRQQDWQVTSPNTNPWQTGTRTRICAVSTINGGPHASWPQTKGASFSAEEVPSLAANFPRSRIVTAVGGVRHRNEPSPARRFRFHADRPDPRSRPAQTGARPPHQNSRVAVQYAGGAVLHRTQCAASRMLVAALPARDRIRGSGTRPAAPVEQSWPKAAVTGRYRFGRQSSPLCSAGQAHRGAAP